MVDTGGAHGEAPVGGHAIDDLSLCTSGERERHQRRVASVAEEKKRLAVGRLVGEITPVVSDALLGPAHGGGSPYVRNGASPIRAEINPATVPGPARQILVPRILGEVTRRC